MRNTVFALLLAMALAAPSALAVDGAVLINQSTVTAAGGFPYIISQPGSYKLSGNLTMNTTSNGNHNGVDIAIGISSSRVTLDLNGFTITVNNVAPVSGCCTTINHDFYAIAELGTFTQVAIRNGNITLASAAPGSIHPPNGYGIFLPTSTNNSIEDLSIYLDFSVGLAAELGPGTLLRHTRMAGYAVAFAVCPSLFVENVSIPPNGGVGPGGGLG